MPVPGASCASVQGRQMPLFMEPLLLKISPDFNQACWVLQPWRVELQMNEKAPLGNMRGLV